MASLELAFDILARDKASKAFNDVAGAADKTGKAADKSSSLGGKLGLALGGAAVAGAAGLFAVLKGGAAEFSENQTATAQLEASLKSTGNVAGVTAMGIKALADSIEAKTGTDGAQVVQGAAMLATFTKIRNEVGEGNNVFERATQAGVDLAAKGFGSVESNAVLLGKALNDPVKGLAALGKQGVTFTEGQKKTIKSLVETGDTLGAQKIILAEIEGQVGGSAAAYGQTLPGQLDRARAAFDGVKETVFTAVLPAVTQLLEFVSTRLIPGFATLAESVGPTFSTIGNILQTVVIPAVMTAAGAIAGFIGAIPLPVLGGIAAAVGVLGAALLVSAAATAVQTAAAGALNAVLLLNPIGLIIAALVGLVAGLVLAYKNSETFRDIVDAAFKVVKDAGQALADFVTETIPAAFESVKQKVTTTVDGFKTFLSTSWEAIKTAVTTVFDAIKTYLTTVFEAYKTVITTVVNAIKVVIETVFNAYKTVIETVFNAVKTYITTVFDAYKTIITTAANGIKAAVETAFGLLKTGVETIFNGIKTVATTAWNGIKTAITTPIEGAKRAVELAINGTKTAITTVTATIPGAIGSALSTVVSKFKTPFESAKTAVSTAIGGLITLVSGVPGRITSALGNLGSLLVNAGRQLMDGLGRGIGEKIAAVVSKVREAVAQIGRLLPGSPIKEGPLKSWNNGGAGKRLMGMLEGGIAAGLPAVVGTLRDGLSEINPSLRAAGDLRSSGSFGSSGGTTINNTINTGADIDEVRLISLMKRTEALYA